MWNITLVGALAAAIVGSSIAYAQQQQSEGERKTYATEQDRTDPRDSRDTLASLKERLRLSPEQEKNWPAFESAYKALRDYRRERMKALEQQARPSDPAERMRRRAESLTGMGAAMARLADAAAPLYGSLNDEQKRGFTSLYPGFGVRPDERRDRDAGARRDGQRPDYEQRDRRDWRDGGGRDWRDRDDYGPPGWRNRRGEDQRDWRDRDYYGERNGRGWRDGGGRGWRDRDDYGPPSWRGRRGEDRQEWRGRDYYDERNGRGWRDGGGRDWRDRDDYGPPAGQRSRRGEDRRDWRDRDDYDEPGWQGRRGEGRGDWPDRDDYDGGSWRDWD
jgi:zinc resistance-associated protein